MFFIYYVTYFLYHLFIISFTFYTSYLLYLLFTFNQAYYEYFVFFTGLWHLPVTRKEDPRIPPPAEKEDSWNSENEKGYAGKEVQDKTFCKTNTNLSRISVMYFYL